MYAAGVLVFALVGASLATARQLGPGDPLSPEVLLADPVAGFASWAEIHGKRYAEDERAARLETFCTNVRRIVAHNAGRSTFTMAVNEFADMSFDEFSIKFGLHRGGASPSRGQTAFSHGAVRDVPASVNWVERGAVTPVKNQGSCGACWAFSTTGAIEGINFLRTGGLISLSEQQLVDCDRKKNRGCSGGYMDWAFEYVEANGGIDTEESYDYWGDDLPCQTSLQDDRHVVAIDGHEDVPSNDSLALKKALSQQPVSVAVCVTADMQFYSGGIIDAASCCSKINHGVLVVGYSDDAATPHWLVKNSWGAAWGIDGYLKLASTSDAEGGTCGILQAGSYPIKNSGDNPTYSEFCGLFGLTECGPGYRCDCQFNLFGILCLSWACAAKEPSVPRFAPA